MSVSVIRHLVSPKLPTALADDAYVDLPARDMCFIYIDYVHVIPMKLDVSKFKDALSRVLQLYPHAAGLLRRDDGYWSIGLTNTPVPVDVEYKLGASSDSFLDGNWVVQKDLSPLLNRHSYGVDILKSSSPLLRLKLTLFDQETCIGISWHHSLGDAILIFRLIHTLSQFYQGLPLEFAAPTFKKFQFPAASPAMLAELSSHMPSYTPHPFDQITPAIAKSLRGAEQVRWRVDINELEELRSTLGAKRQNAKCLSKQDCLTAYVVTVLNHHRDKPVQTVRGASSYRHVHAPFVSENVASNFIILVSTGVPMDMAGIAGALRDALIQAREPDCISLLESAKSALFLEGDPAAPTPVTFRSDELFVNSHGVIDWCSAHFGSPDGTRFHTTGCFHHSLRCFRSNPEKLEDGVWRPRQSIEVSVGASAELKPKIMETLARGIRYMLDN